MKRDARPGDIHRKQFAAIGQLDGKFRMDSCLVHLTEHVKAKQLIIRLDANGSRQRQGKLRAGIEALAMTHADPRSNAGPLKNPEHLGVRKEP